MARATPRLFGLPSAACLLAACASSSENPFAGVPRVREPPAACRVVFSADLHSPESQGAPEIYCVGLTGAPPERLTFCSDTASTCALLEMAPAADRLRGAVRRVTLNTNRDERLADAGGAALIFVDLRRGAQTELVPARESVSGVDWSPTREVLVFAALGPGGAEDLFRRDVGAEQTSSNLTNTPSVAERRPRFDVSGDVAYFERREAGARSTICSLYGVAQPTQITPSGPAGAPLIGTPYAVGDDADPAGSPDGRWVVFRRLVALRPDGGGAWEILRAPSDGSSSPVPLVSGGGMERGAPDWSADGIVFSEMDPGTQETALILIDPDRGVRQILALAPRGYRMAFPRWL